MDPITAAIVSALAAGLADVGKEGIRDAYQGLKSLLYRKFGPQSSVFKAVEDLESNPSSPARKAVLQEEVAQSRADRDPELLRTANYVIQKVQYPSSMKQSGTGNMQVQEAQQILAASGQGNTLAGRNIINGRPGVVAFVSIVLVAIFAFVLWQIPPFRELIPGQAPTPAPTSLTSTSEGTLTYFCMLVRSNGSSEAYTGLTSDNFRKNVSAAQFEQDWSFMTHPISDCIGSIKGLSGSSTNGTITVQIFAHTQQNSQQEVYNVTLIQNTNGQWKIDTMTKKT